MIFRNAIRIFLCVPFWLVVFLTDWLQRKIYRMLTQHQWLWVFLPSTGQTAASRWGLFPFAHLPLFFSSPVVFLLLFSHLPLLVFVSFLSVSSPLPPIPPPRTCPRLWWTERLSLFILYACKVLFPFRNKAGCWCFIMTIMKLERLTYSAVTYTKSPFLLRNLLLSP